MTHYKKVFKVTASAKQGYKKASKKFYVRVK